MGDEATSTTHATDAAGAVRAAVVAFWALNVPLGTWLARGYLLACAPAEGGIAAEAMGVWLLALAVAVILAPGLAGALVLERVSRRRAAVAWACGWCVAAQCVLLADSALYGLLRLHLTDARALATLGEPTAFATVGVAAGTWCWGIAALVALLVAEATMAAALLAARRTRAFEWLRSVARRVPRAVRWGVVAVLALPPVAAALADPYGPAIEVGRHFLIPFAPRARSGAEGLDALNAALRDVAAARRQPAGGRPVPAIAVPAALSPSSRPSILILCIESLRTDVVTDEVMPNLTALERECVVARSHYAEGNTTFHSVFAILSGQHPLWYGRARADRAEPAPLVALRTAGYRLHALASAELEWVGMDETVLQRPLFATYEQLLGDPVEGDRRVCDHLLRIARDADGPFLAFAILNATHFHYFYPPDAELFRPAIGPAINPLATGSLLRRRDELWNRYRNAAHYVDGLVGGLLAALRRDGLLDKLILVVVADHGESLLEEGLLCHANSFHDIQVRVPCLVRYPGGAAREVAGLTQDADLFPSLFAEMGLAPLADALPGYRTLRPELDEERPSAVVAMAAPHAPAEFLLVTAARRCRFLLNVEPDGRVVLEAGGLTSRSGGPIRPAAGAEAARETAGALSAWLDRQGLTGAPAR